jgi:RimJ/RimL family protein N-acetyltransferase
MGARLSQRQSGARPVRIHRATARDLPQFTRNLQSVADEGKYLFIEEVTKKRAESIGESFKDKGCLTLIAEVRENGRWKAVGGLTLNRYGDASKSKHVRVLAIFLIEGYRGTGIGSRLIVDALDWARKKKGVEKVTLGVFSNNTGALRLYEKLGFQTEGVRKKQYYISGRPEDEIDMALFVK